MLAGEPLAASRPMALGLRRPDVAGRYRELRAHLRSPLYRNAYALMINTGVTGLLGVAYWLLAARHYSAVEVGRASAIYAAMSLLSGLTAFSLLGAVTRFVPQSGRRTGFFVRRAYLFSSLASVLVAVPFLLTVRHWGASYSQLTGLIPGLVFIACVIAWGIFTLQDGVLTGLRSAAWVPLENGTFGVVKIVLLLALAAAVPALGIDISWMLPVIVSLPLINLLIFAKLMPRHHLLTERPPAAGHSPDRPLPGRRLHGRTVHAGGGELVADRGGGAQRPRHDRLLLHGVDRRGRPGSAGREHGYVADGRGCVRQPDAGRELPFRAAPDALHPGAGRDPGGLDRPSGPEPVRSALRGLRRADPGAPGRWPRCPRC